MKKSTVILIHVVFWLFVLINKSTSLLLPGLNPTGGPSHYWTLLLSFFVAGMLPFYLGYFFRLNKLRSPGKWIYLAVVLFVCLILPACFCLYEFTQSPGTLSSSPLYIRSFLSISVNLIFYCLIGFGFRSFQHSLEQRKRVEQLEKERLHSELALLRTQLNPHFLFNTLHNIDTLIETAPEQASGELLKLSDLMRYMLYDSDVEQISLQKEVEHLENYLALQRLRLPGPASIVYTKKGDFSKEQIAPMLLIPFVENCFKHFKPAEGTAIRIDISLSGRKLHFSSSNPYDPADSNKDSSSGIGLETVKQRLELIYSNKYTLEIDNKNRIFDVRLSIDLY